MLYHIVADSGCDVSPKLINSENCTISHVPLNMQVGDKVYLDDDTLNQNDYLSDMESTTLAVKTSAPSPALFLEKFKVGDNIFVVTLSSKLSATYQSAVSAKDMYIEEYGKKFIHVFDSLTASMGEAVIALKIADLLKNGIDATECVEQVNHFMKGMRTYFILEKFDNLIKTGRMKPSLAKVVSFLNVKLICSDNGEGEIAKISQARGYPNAMSRLVQIIKENTPDIESRVIGITHVKALEKAEELKKELLAHVKPKDILIQESRGITTTYANRGGVVVAL